MLTPSELTLSRDKQAQEQTEQGEGRRLDEEKVS
jgi:hypothetical protein